MGLDGFFEGLSYIWLVSWCGFDVFEVLFFGDYV